MFSTTSTKKVGLLPFSFLLALALRQTPFSFCLLGSLFFVFCCRPLTLNFLPLSFLPLQRLLHTAYSLYSHSLYCVFLHLLIPDWISNHALIINKPFGNKPQLTVGFLLIRVFDSKVVLLPAMLLLFGLFLQSCNFVCFVSPMSFVSISQSFITYYYPRFTFIRLTFNALLFSCSHKSLFYLLLIVTG